MGFIGLMVSGGCSRCILWILSHLLSFISIKLGSVSVAQ